VSPVPERKLPVRWVTSSYLGIGTSPLAELSVEDGTL
jgi:hypothetical protein